MDKFTDIDQFLQLLQGVEPKGSNHWVTLCPCHNDRDPSLDIKLDGNKILLKDFGGCQTPNVMKTLGLTMSHLWLDDGSKPAADRGRRKTGERGKVVARYVYVNEAGEPLYRKLRKKPKSFEQERYDKGAWVGGLGCMKGVRRVLFALPEVIAGNKEGKDIYWFEGERDAINAREKLGIIATTCTEGAGSLKEWNPGYGEALKGAKRVVLVPDQDSAGIDHIRFIAKHLDGVVEQVQILTLPCKDISDWLPDHDKAEFFDNLLPQAMDYTPELVADLITEYASELPVVIVTGVHTRDITAKALESLHKKNNPAQIFRRSDRLIRVSVDESGKPYTEELHSAAFKGCIDRACNFVRIAKNSDELIPTPAPKDVVDDGLTRPDLWKFPPLLGITEVPVLRPDGTVLSKPGYDDATRLYYSPAQELEIPTIPDTPTESQIKTAAELVIEPVCDFPFDSQASWANAIGTLFAPILRPMITTPVPMSLFDKPQQGTGATLLADVVSIIATGRCAAIQSPPESNDAWRKAITSILWKGQLVATLDNIEGELESAALAAALTSTIWQDRLLGQTETLQIINRLMWIGTGNNVKLKGDLPRRCIWCRMDAHTPRPWMRDVKFKHPDLTKWVTENRGAILAAMLTIARAWTLAGMPVPEDIPILGGYDSYCRVVGGVLAFMGVKGFVGNLDRMYNETDTSTPQWACFFEQWHDLLAENTYTSAELVSWILDNGDFKESLPDDLADIFGGPGKNYSVMLGQRLHHKIDVQYDNGCVLYRAGTKKRAVTWQVKKLTSPTTSPIFSLGGEVSEVSTTLAQGQKLKDGHKNALGGKVDITSPTSPLATKRGEVGVKKGLDSSFSCPNCKGREYWFEHGENKKCVKCWTPPEGAPIFEDD